jgi:hypothetical protein
MLASETFRGAERSKRLLSFIVEEALRGRTDRLKDYTLGADALGRGDRCHGGSTFGVPVDLSGQTASRSPAYERREH